MYAEMKCLYEKMNRVPCILEIDHLRLYDQDTSTYIPLHIHMYSIVVYMFGGRVARAL